MISLPRWTRPTSDGLIWPDYLDKLREDWPA